MVIFSSRFVEGMLIHKYKALAGGGSGRGGRFFPPWGVDHFENSPSLGGLKKSHYLIHFASSLSLMEFQRIEI